MEVSTMIEERVTTVCGRAVRLPAYIPVTTYSSEHPTDRLVRPFLPRLADMQMVSFHYAKRMPAGATAALPTFIDSGGFAALMAGAEILERADGLGVIRRRNLAVGVAEGVGISVFGTDQGRAGDSESTKIQGYETPSVQREFGAQGAAEAPADIEAVTPELVLELQLRRAAWGATLDLPIPPALASDAAECERRIRLTVANARWALRELRERQRADGDGMRLFGAVQGFDMQSYVSCACELVASGFEDLALGGFVPRISQPQMLLEIVRRVREVMDEAAAPRQRQLRLLHCFGIGEPSLARAMFERGATSVDSSSFARAAASGKRWDGIEWDTVAPSPLERAHAALANLEFGVRESRPRPWTR
jgi:tRNA-guanine family transglycosylase